MDAFIGICIFVGLVWLVVSWFLNEGDLNNDEFNEGDLSDDEF